MRREWGGRLGRLTAMPKRAMPQSVSKPGKYGTLFLYTVTYTDPGDPGFGEDTWRTWAYSLEHAEDNFYDNDDGFRALTIQRVHDRIGQHRAVKHAARQS